MLLSLTAPFPIAMALSDQLWVVLLGAFLHGFGLQVFDVFWDLSIQQNVAPDKLARVYSFDMVGSFVARPLGLALTGPVAVAGRLPGVAARRRLRHGWPRRCWRSRPPTYAVWSAIPRRSRTRSRSAA